MTNIINNVIKHIIRWINVWRQYNAWNKIVIMVINIVICGSLQVRVKIIFTQTTKINKKKFTFFVLQSLVSQICPEWTIIPRESIEDLWQCHHFSSVPFSSTGETSSQRSSPTLSSVTQVCLQVQLQANAKLAFVFRCSGSWNFAENVLNSQGGE